MLFSPSVILEKITKDFVTANEAFSGFPDSGSLWDECIRTVKDATLMNHIIFNNDVMEIPPVRTFLKANRALDGGFNSYQKKALNAFWGFVFRDIFFYGGQEDNAGVSVLGVRKASRFTNPPSDIMVGDLDEASGKIVIPVPRQKMRMNLADPGTASVHRVPELHRNDDHGIDHRRSDNRRMVDRRTDDSRIDHRGIDDNRTDDNRIDHRGIDDNRMDDNRIDHRGIDDNRIDGNRIDHRGIDDNRMDNRRMDDNRIDSGTMGDNRLGDQDLEAQRLEEQRISEQRIENQRDADRMVEAQRLEEQRLAEQRIENERLAESGTEEPGIEDKRIDELRIKEPRV